MSFHIFCCVLFFSKFIYNFISFPFLCTKIDDSIEFFTLNFLFSAPVEIHMKMQIVFFSCNGFYFCMVVKFKCADANKQHEKQTWSS